MTDTLKSDLNGVISALLEAGLGLKSTHVAAVEKAIAELDRLEAEVKKLVPSTEPVQAAGDTAGDYIVLRPHTRRCRFKNCPTGLFLFGDTLALMTEYATERKLAGQIVGVHRDAYIVSSGEYFWGGVTTGPERDELMVTPLSPAETSDQGQRSQTPMNTETAEKPKPVSLVEKFSRERIGGNIDYWAKNTFGSPSHDQEAREIILWLLRTLDQERCV